MFIAKSHGQGYNGDMGRVMIGAYYITPFCNCEPITTGDVEEDYLKVRIYGVCVRQV